jgi:GrpB-like predicted nucleotidyltransferase (UPF0157 family)
MAIISMSAPLQIVQYDDRYPRVFAKVRKALELALPSDVEIEHVGSTAVRGLGGKAIIDILVGVRKSSVETVVKTLEDLGYTFDPVISTVRKKPFLYGTCRRGNSAFRLHTHVTRHESQHWREMLLFRDYMRRHQDEAERYFHRKHEWAAKAGADRERFTRLKAAYVRRIVAKAAEEERHEFRN